jgi:hypothetical protein
MTTASDRGEGLHLNYTGFHFKKNFEADGLEIEGPVLRVLLI